MRWLVLALLVLHGLIHFMGPAKAFGLAELEALTRPIPRAMGVVWLLAGLGFLLSAALLLVARPPAWAWMALGSVVLSQVVIAASWSDAWFGTVANVLVALAAAYAIAAYGPWGLRAEYREAVEAARAGAPEVGETVTEADLAPLPDPVAQYLRFTGAVGRPRPAWFRATMTGRIRGGLDEPWMEFTAEQHNVLGDEPARFFLMDAVRGGLPVDVLHVYRGGRATMRARVLSLVTVVDEAGPGMDQAETVTVLNDMALFAPGGLVDPAITWEAVDDTTARARYRVGEHEIRATFLFDGEGRLVDFVSDDRMAATDSGFVAMRWSTPVGGWRTREDGRRVLESGEALWHPEVGEPWTYVEMEITKVEVGPGG